MMYLLCWYLIGLVSALIIDYLEAKIVSSNYLLDFKEGKCTAYYAGGVRPAAVWVFVIALGGLFNVGYLMFTWRAK